MYPLDESLAISSELGMRRLMERVLSRRNILKALTHQPLIVSKKKSLWSPQNQVSAS